jgi:hypothetical protein
VIDYERHARQIALPEVGPDGQRALATTPVDLSSLPAIAGELHARAGGCVSVPPGVPQNAESPATELGVAAWGCVEAARRVLGEEARPMPDGLMERLR